MIPRLFSSLLLVVSVVLVACIDMSAPSNGPAAISDLKLPSPSVIVGDTMRDSLGKVAPLIVFSYTVQGIPSASPGTLLFITDSAPAAKVGPLGTLIGVRLGSVRILGQVNQLQTPLVTIPVTRRPIELRAAPFDTLRATTTGDTSVKATTPLTASVLAAGDSASQGIIVQYALVSAPASRDPQHPAVYIANPSNGQLSPLDTSDVLGQVSRNLVVVTGFLADTALQLGHVIGQAKVTITSSYAGKPLAGSPFTYNVPIKVTFPAAP